MDFRNYIFIFSLFFFGNISSQNINEVTDSSINSQFNLLYKKSSNYKQYKVINKQRYFLLKKNVLDSLLTLKNKIFTNKQLLKEKKNQIQKLNSTLNLAQEKLTISLAKNNQISFFGFFISKTTYKVFVWFLIFILLGGLLYFFYLFKNSNILTEAAKQNLLDVEKEFEQHRKKSIEREQKLRRELLNEINKNR